jgi:hypothetical protein
MDYQAAVKAAEEAVGKVQDPKLKEIAFAQILGKLLSDEGVGGHEKSKPSKVGPAKPKAASAKKGDGIIDWVRDLVASDFFKTPRSMKAILTELSERSHHLDRLDLSWPLRHLCHNKVLRRKKIAPDAGKAEIWHWSNW